jgi:hypothetical protein
MNKDIKVLDPNVMYGNSSRTGTCFASINEIESQFGPNKYNNDDDGDNKVSASWTIEISGKKLELYSYKFHPYESEYDIDERYMFSIAEVDNGALRSLQGIMPELWLFTESDVRRIKDTYGPFDSYAIEKYIEKI